MPSSPVNNRRALHPGDLFAAALLVAWAVFMCLRIRYGFDLTDEGMYVSSTDRLLHGDLPFRDDQENPLRQFDVLMSWFWHPFGGFSLIAARTVCVVMQLTQMVAVWVLVRHWLGRERFPTDSLANDTAAPDGAEIPLPHRCAPWIAACAAMLVPRTPLLAMWAPGYNDLAVTFITVHAVALGMAGSGGRKTALAWGTLAGMAYALAVLCYAPMVSLFVVTMAMAGWGWWRDGWRHPWVVAAAGAGAAVAAAVAAYSCWILASGLGHDLHTSIVAMIDQQAEASPLLARFLFCLTLISGFLVHLLVSVLILIGMRWLLVRPRARADADDGTRRSAAGAGIVGWGLLILFAYNLWGWPQVTRYQYQQFFLLYGPGGTVTMFRILFTQMVIGVAGILVFVVPDGVKALTRGRADGLSGVMAALAVFAALAMVTAVASTITGYSGLNIRGPAEAIGAAGIAVFLLRARAPSRSAALIALVGQIAMAAMVGYAAWVLVYHDPSPAECTATYAHGPLAGVHSTPEKVVPFEALQTWIDANEPADARMIAYHDVPGLYFATRRRPALPYAWTTPNWPFNNPQASNRWFAALVDDLTREAQPDFCVRCLLYHDYGQPMPTVYRGNDPLHVYVNTHYRPVWRCWPYEVLTPLPPGAEPVMPTTLIDVLAPPDPAAPPTIANAQINAGITADADADGNLVLTADATAPDIVAALTVHGGDEIALRLTLESQSPGFTVLLLQDGGTDFIPCGNFRSCHRWDVTFPAGPVVDRGFAIMRDPGCTGPFVFHRLSLARFPAVPGPPNPCLPIFEPPKGEVDH